MMFYLVLNIGIYTYTWKGLDYIKKKTIILVIVCRNTKADKDKTVDDRYTKKTTENS